MNQIAASILILSATICGHISAIRPQSDGFGGLMALAALGLGIWGAMSLLMTSVRERERMLDDAPHVPSIGTSAVNGLRNLASTYAAGFGNRYESTSYARDLRLSPDISAQVAALAQLRGQDRSQVVEELLRRHMPRPTTTRVA